MAVKTDKALKIKWLQHNIKELRAGNLSRAELLDDLDNQINLPSGTCALSKKDAYILHKSIERASTLNDCVQKLYNAYLAAEGLYNL